MRKCTFAKVLAERCARNDDPLRVFCLSFLPRRGHRPCTRLPARPARLPTRTSVLVGVLARAFVFWYSPSAILVFPKCYFGIPQVLQRARTAVHGVRTEARAGAWGRAGGACGACRERRGRNVRGEEGQVCKVANQFPARSG